MCLELPGNAIEEVQLRLNTSEGKEAVGKARLGVKGRVKALRLVEDPDENFIKPLVDMERP